MLMDNKGGRQPKLTIHVKQLFSCVNIDADSEYGPFACQFNLLLIYLGLRITIARNDTLMLTQTFRKTRS